MTENSPIILWYRRDLRLGDHPALTEAVASGRPVIPLFIHDDVVAGQGAAARFRLGLSVGSLADDLRSVGSQLILRRGKALDVLRDLIAETGAGAVYWTRLYDPIAKARDTEVKSVLKEDGIDAQSFAGHVLFEPWSVQTGGGAFYKVFTPMWKNVRTREVEAELPAPGKIPAPEQWPDSDDLADWAMGSDMRRGAEIVRRYCTVGEAAARDRLHTFLDERVARYDTLRDVPSVKGTSGLSENLTYGEISPRTCWHAAYPQMVDGVTGAETFLKELVWREFAYHLVYHTPQITTENWKPDWDAFPWNTDEEHPHVVAWKQGRTGIPFVDAAMREMYVTGVMHNRGRMIVASYLTKHLMTDWKIGMRWFDDCLIDWDPASNAMGWQWSAGSGPDATPYFRVFNPVTQIEKFDRSGGYVKAWIAEGQGNPPESALQYFDAVPKSWNLSPDARYPHEIVSPAAGRQKALDAYQNRDF